MGIGKIKTELALKGTIISRASRQLWLRVVTKGTAIPILGGLGSGEKGLKEPKNLPIFHSKFHKDRDHMCVVYHHVQNASPFRYSVCVLNGKPELFHKARRYSARPFLQSEPGCLINFASSHHPSRGNSASRVLF